MRILVVLALTAALVWAGFRMFGAEVTAGDGLPGPGVTQPGEQMGASSATRETQTPPQPQPPAAVTEVAPRIEEPSNPFEVPADDRVVVDPRWIELARNLSHARFDAVIGALNARAVTLSSEREQVLRCLVEALSGQADRANEMAAVLYERGTLAPRDVTLLQAALGRGEPPARGQHTDDLDLASELAVLLRVAERDSARGQLSSAARFMTRMFEAELDAPWTTAPADLDAWVAVLRDVHRRYRWDPRAEWPHFELTVQPGDGLTTIRQRALAQKPDLNLSTGLIARANRLGDGAIHAGQVLRIPTEPVTVLVDVSKNWMLYRIGGEVVEAWPVGTGADGNETLIGNFLIGVKQPNPTWWPRNKPQVPFGHPDNPLGTRWLGWREVGSDSDTSFGFHGTWLPETIGHAASEGCVRLRNEDVEVLYDILPQGALITVRR